MYNLLSNAVKFTPDGGSVALSLRRVPRQEVAAVLPRADLRVFPPLDRQCTHFLEITVADTGIGIAEEQLSRLFQAFTQIDSSLARRYEGTGLGLVMEKKLAELHGGGVMVQSTLGQGSRFVVWLPWREALPEGASEAPLPGVAERKEGKRVLLIEDDLQSAAITRRHLEEAGYQVLHAVDGEAGLRLADESHPDAIVLDIMLPGLDGWEVLARLKGQAATASIPVVILSIVDDARRGFTLGASQVLLKPVGHRELLAAMAALGFVDAQGERILVVDDDPAAVSLLARELTAAGFKPIAAYGGEEALALMRADPPRAVILDLMMGEVSGFDVIEAMRKSPQSATIPVIVVTAKALDEAEHARLKRQVQAVLEKSRFDADVLLAEVRRALASADQGLPQAK